jgi:hypothetical protein
MTQSMTRAARMLSISSLLLVASTPLAARQDTKRADDHQPQVHLDPELLPLTLAILGDGRLEGVHGTIKIYKDPNGERVWMILLHCESADEARRVYDARVSKSLAVVKQEPTAKSSEHASGQTAVLNVAGKDDKRSETEIVIMFGSEVRVVDSYIASDALALAARLEPKP